MRLRFATDEELRDYQDRGPEYEAAPERDEVILYKGTGRPAEEVELRPTNIRPYMMFPGLARAEQEVALSRYGGSPIQEAAASAGQGQGPPQPQDAAGGNEPSPPPYRRDGAEFPAGFRIERPEDVITPQARLAFEQTVFRQIGGNPYMIDTQREIDRATAEDMPKLFERIFRGQAIWADRHNLSPEQKKVWLDELKRYRAYLKDRIEGERRAKIDSYKWMMSRFDDFQKQAEADLRRRREEMKDARVEAKDEAARLSEVKREERAILKRMSEIVTKAAEAGDTDLADAVAEEYRQLGEQLSSVRRERDALMMRRDPDYREQKRKEFYQKVAPDTMVPAHGPWRPGGRKDGVAPEVRGALPQDERGEAAPADAEEAPTTDAAGTPEPRKKEKFRVDLQRPIEVGGFRFKRPASGSPVEVRYHRASGRLLGKFPDGHIEVLDLVE